MKSYVKNRAKVEGSIANGYLFEESAIFASRYMDDVETRFNRPGRVNDEWESDIPMFSWLPKVGRPLQGFDRVDFDAMELKQAHRYVVTNCRRLDNYRR